MFQHIPMKVYSYKKKMFQYFFKRINPFTELLYKKYEKHSYEKKLFQNYYTKKNAVTKNY